VTTTNKNNLKSLLGLVPPGTPVSAKTLGQNGISNDLAAHYVKSGWLVRLGRGVYARPEDSIEVRPALRLLEEKVPGLHVAGRSALEWHGITHYVAQDRPTLLYGWQSVTLPVWFSSRFPALYHRRRIFNETPEQLIQVGPFHGHGPMVSTPERGLIEMLSEVGVSQDLDEARKITEGTHTLRPMQLLEALSACKSVKAVRLCIQLGSRFRLPWRSHLTIANLPTGGNSTWVRRIGDEWLVLDP